jgi:hypothetical protein
MERPIKSKRQLKPKKLPQECLCCGEENPWVFHAVKLTVPFRDVEHEIQATVNQCRHCDAISTTEEQSELILLKAREMHFKWVTEKFRKMQKELGISLRALSEKIDLPIATLARISCGDHSIDASTEKLLWIEMETLQIVQRREKLMQIMEMYIGSTHGKVTIEYIPEKSNRYTAILVNAAQSPLSYVEEFEREMNFSDQSLRNLITA